MMNNNPIDFVVTWVNGEDDDWRQKKNHYDDKYDGSKEMNTASRYRNFHIFKYWFRAVDRYAPWVHRVYVITDEQTPSWLNVKYTKVVCINHSDFIDKDKLPTFNSNAIELNVNKITGLAENFVLFNDDTFINSSVKPEDFFKNNLPRDVYVESPIISTKGSVAHAMVNDMQVINSNFSKSKFYKKNFLKVFNPLIGKKVLRTLALLPANEFSGIWNSHLPVPYKKQTFDTLWNLMPDSLNETSTHKFRTSDDYSHWLMRYWQLVSGQYELQKRNWGYVYDLGKSSIDDLGIEILQSKHKMICLNDTDNLDDFNKTMSELVEIFSKTFPKKSRFEN